MVTVNKNQMDFSATFILSTALFSVFKHVSADPTMEEYTMHGDDAEEIELSISANDLIGKDILSKSDPMCVTLVKPTVTSSWEEYHRTSVIQNTHNPDFSEKPVFKYKFEEIICLKFELYDSDSNDTNLKKHDFLGYIECHLSEIISVKTKTFNLKRKNIFGIEEEIRSTITIVPEKLQHNDGVVMMQLSGIHLDKKGFLSSDPYVEIYKINTLENFILVHRTEFIKHDLNPKWQQFEIPIQKLCNGDYKRTLKFKCLNHNDRKDSSCIGEFLTSLEELSQEKKATFPLIHPEKKKKYKSYGNSGLIHIKDIQFVASYKAEFIEHLKGGLKIHCSVAIDFTESNGNPALPTSLHYISWNQNIMNHYEMAISSVVPIIEDYCDKRFLVLGFGAELLNKQIYHDFFVSMNPSAPFCVGTKDVLDAYRRCVPMITFSLPTNFSPVIEHVINYSVEYPSDENYFILLILTDGQICDMSQTKKSIVRAARLPISIIIVGIGNENFDSMDTLDADKERLLADEEFAIRDIVQFVRFNKFISQGDPSTSRMHLAEEVLHEIPKQIVTFMRLYNYQPSVN